MSLGENKVIKDPLPHTSLCETQWRHSVKIRLYNTSPPYFIVKTKEVEFHRISNFQPLEVVDRCSETQPQVVENLNILT